MTFSHLDLTVRLENSLVAALYRHRGIVIDISDLTIDMALKITPDELAETPNTARKNVIEFKQWLKNNTVLSDIAKVSILEDEMRKHEQRVIPIKHYFSPGVYAREITIPADTLLTGRIHKYEQLNILSGGEISVLTHEGMKRVKAPFTVVSPPGTKRVAYAHTECTWTTILATEETDPDKIEAQFTVATEQEFLDFSDFVAAIAEYGFDPDTARRISENTDDQIEMPEGSYKFTVAASDIEGQGIIAVSSIASNEMIGPARIHGKRTPLGRFTNHARHPNAKMAMNGPDIDLVAVNSIGRDEEITIDYRQAGEAQKLSRIGSS